MRRAMRAPITFNDREIFLTASIGIALARRPAASHRGSAQGCRARDVSRQAHRRRPHRSVQARDARAQDRPPDAGIRTAPRARARRDHDPLSADHAAGGSLGRRLRGAGALGPSEDGPPVAVGIHLHRRGDRPDRRSRPVRAGAHRAPARHLAALGAQARADVRQRQRVVAPVAAPRPHPRPAHRARALGRWRAARSSSSSPNRW